MKKIFFLLNILFASFAIWFFAFINYFELLTFLIYTIIFSAFIASILRIVFKSFSSVSFKKVWFMTIIRIFSFVWIFLTIICWFVYYFNNINPSVLSNIFIQNSNWQKIVFVEMSHIASEKFYEEKASSIKKLSDEWYVFLVEWVGEWSEESHDLFNDAIWFDFSNDFYEKISKSIDLTHQTSNIYNGVPGEKLISVDMTMDEIADALNSLSWSVDNSSKSQNIPDFDISELAEKTNNLSSNEKFVLKQLSYFVLNLFTRVNNFDSTIDNMPDSQKKLFDIIINSRNQKIVDYIMQNPDKNIAIVYWALHYQWVMKLLQENNNGWKIISVEKFFPYSQ